MKIVTRSCDGVWRALQIVRIVTIIGATFLPASPLAAQIVGKPVFASGRCDAKSGVTIDDGEFSRFSCDIAVISRTERGSVLIQFGDKKGDDGRLLGFAGTIEGRQGFGADKTQMMAVERLYLQPGADPVPVSDGTCIMNWTGLARTGGTIWSVLCGASGEAGDSHVKAFAAILVKSRK